MEVARGGGEVPVPHQALDSVDIGAGFKQVRGEGVTQRVDAAGFGDAGATLGGVEEAIARCGPTAAVLDCAGWETASAWADAPTSNGAVP